MYKQVEITDIDNLYIGHASDQKSTTGCTSLYFKGGFKTAVDVRGAAPGTKETDLLLPENIVDTANAICLAGGSAYGLDATSGIMKYLEENNEGFFTSDGYIPIVPGAVIYDLKKEHFNIRPTHEMGYKSIKNAGKINLNGNIGAGTGATVGKIYGPERSMKGGLGTYAIKSGDLIVGAIIVVNAVGNIYDYNNKKYLAGLLNEKKDKIISTEEEIINNEIKPQFGQNTTIGAIITNAKLTKTELKRVAISGHDGLTKTILPVHTIMDGDTLFASSNGMIEASLLKVCTMAVKAVENAVLSSVR